MGETKQKKHVYGLLGRNISYSLSPLMHNAAFGHFGISAEYRIFDIDQSLVIDFLNGISAGDISGMNVTVPYKVTACDFISGNKSNHVEELALRVGAINTIKVDAGCLEGFNTDGEGFLESLKEDLKLDYGDIAGRDILMLGSGGAARALSFQLLASDFRPAKIILYDTVPERADSLVSGLEADFGPGSAVSAGAREVHDAAKVCALIINATPLGTDENDPMPLDPAKVGSTSAALYDLVYARTTELQLEWKKKRLPVCGGLGMLVNQAALAFRIWNGEGYPRGEVMSAMRSALPEKMRERYGWNI